MHDLKKQTVSRPVKLQPVLGADYTASELGQFMPKGPKETYGVSAEELQWAIEKGAKNDDEAATLIVEHRKTIGESA